MARHLFKESVLVTEVMQSWQNKAVITSTLPSFLNSALSAKTQLKLFYSADDTINLLLTPIKQ
jgi:hypothetical protein